MNFMRNGHGWILMVGFILFIMIICMSYSPLIYRKRTRLPMESITPGPKESNTSIPKESITPVIDSEKQSSVLSNALHFHFPLSKEVILFNAFVDTRPRNYTNTTMIFIAASREVLSEKRIIGCGAGRAVAKEFIVRYVFEDLLMHRWYGKPIFPYEQMAVECYEVPVIPGEKAFVLYKSRTNVTVALHTANSVVIPRPRVTPKPTHNISVVVCTKAHNRKVTWLPEILRYQKTLGVDHVHLNFLDDLIRDDGLQDYLATDEFFLKNYKDDYVTLQVWKEWYGDKEWYLRGTILMYLDCLYRYRGTYDYVSFMDTDDFFTVRVPGMSYKDMIVKYCSKETTGSCSFNWLWYFPGVCGLARNVSEDGNVTAAIVPHRPERNVNLKSIHLTKAVLDSSFHDARCDKCRMKGYERVHISPDIAYVAHQRMYVDKEKKCPK